MVASRGLRHAVRACRRIVRESGTNFYYPLLLLPRRKREALMAVYAFCRRSDDIADVGDTRGRTAAIAAWREELGRCYDGRPAHPVTRVLAAAVRRFRIPRSYFEDLLDGVEMDTYRARYRTFDDLRVYCYRVASTVGLICIEIFGYRRPAARRFAIDLGIALQLTNILRDIPSDARRGRLYLPQEDLDRFGCPEADVLACRRTPALERLLAFECGRARSFYRGAWEAMPPGDRRSLAVADAIGRIYYEILREIERRGFDLQGGKARISRARKAALALGAWGRSQLGLPRRLPPGLRASSMATADRPGGAPLARASADS